MVKGRDVHRQLLANIFDRKMRELYVAPHRHVRTVELQGDARFGDRLVLVAQRLGDREHVSFIVGVEAIGEEQRGDAGRGGAHESLVPAGEPLQPFGIDPRRYHVLDGDLGRARGRRAPRAAGVAVHFGFGPGEFLEILELVAARLAVDPGQAMFDVCRIARLRHLAVADYRDARIDLAAEHIRGRIVDRLVEFALIDRLAAFAGEHQVEQMLRAREAPCVGRLEAAHASSPRTIRAPSAIAFILPNATSRGRYLSPQSGAMISRSAAMCGSARRIRAATTSGSSTAWVDKSSTPRMIVLPGKLSRIAQSS